MRALLIIILVSCASEPIKKTCPECAWISETNNHLHKDCITAHEQLKYRIFSVEYVETCENEINHIDTFYYHSLCTLDNTVIYEVRRTRVDCEY